MDPDEAAHHELPHLDLLVCIVHYFVFSVLSAKGRGSPRNSHTERNN